MAGNSMQMSGLIEALHSKTMSGNVAWQQSAERGKFQARIGEYIIQLSTSSPIYVSSPSSIPPGDIQIHVTKIDGQLVDAAGGYGGLLSMTQNRTPLSSTDQAKLREIYVYLSTTNQDLEKLIKLLQ